MFEGFLRSVILGALSVSISACSGHDSTYSDPGPPDAGTLDTSFDANDVVSPAMGAFKAGTLAIAVQDDGKIVVAGYSKGFTGLTEFAVARYHPDGTLDMSFDGDGMAITSIGSASETGMSLAIQADHKIVVVGYLGPPGSHEFAVERYKPDGSLDPSFGDNGTVMTSLSQGNDEAMAVAIQSDGKIVVAGTGASAFELVRYMPDGSLDPTFGDAGMVLTSGHGAGAWGIAIQADGKIVVAGGSGDTVLARYLANGKLDPSFGDDGIVTTDVGPIKDQTHALAIHKDGRIVVGGFYESPTGSDFSVVHYKPDGSLDKSFGTNGIVKTQVAAADESASAVIVRPDGTIIAVGAQSEGSSGEIVITRYDANGDLDAGDGDD